MEAGRKSASYISYPPSLLTYSKFCDIVTHTLEIQRESVMNRNVVLLIGIFLAFGAFVMTWLEASKYIKYKAYNDCGSISQYQVTQDGARITYPVPEVYKACLDRIK
jgi:hypothetical protein